VGAQRRTFSRQSQAHHQFGRVVNKTTRGEANKGPRRCTNRERCFELAGFFFYIPFGLCPGHLSSMPNKSYTSQTLPDTNSQSAQGSSDSNSRMSDIAIRKKKNADAQAAFRARRANYIATLEETGWILSVRARFIGPHLLQSLVSSPSFYNCKIPVASLGPMSLSCDKKMHVCAMNSENEKNSGRPFGRLGNQDLVLLPMICLLCRLHFLQVTLIKT
jgi:hypothetical protein